MKIWIVVVPVIILLILFGITIFQIITYESIIIPNYVKITLQKNIDDSKLLTKSQIFVWVF